MLIPNPIYDVVFQYLFDDGKAARLLLSALLGEEVLLLHELPTGGPRTAAKPDGTEYLVLSIDFAATVRTEDGERKAILVAIRKACSALDVARRRRRLGPGGAHPDDIHLERAGRGWKLPVVTIYFLAEGLDGTDVPVLRLDRLGLDVATGETGRATDPLVEALGHEAIVVQVNRLRGRRRTELEGVLAIFDRGRAAHRYNHMLDIPEGEYPEPYLDVLHRLMRAGAETRVMEMMDLEDDILDASRHYARVHSDLRQAIAEKNRRLEALESGSRHP